MACPGASWPTTARLGARPGLASGTHAAHRLVAGPGIRVGHGRAYHPQSQGKDERFHRTFKAEVLDGRRLETLNQAQDAFDRWREIYNAKDSRDCMERADLPDSPISSTDHSGKRRRSSALPLPASLLVSCGQSAARCSCKRPEQSRQASRSRFFDATPHAEFLYQCVEQTVEVDLPAETTFLKAYDIFRRKVANIVDMPDRTSDLLFRFLHPNNGAVETRPRARIRTAER